MLTLKLGRISKVGIGQKRSLMDSKLPVTCIDTKSEVRQAMASSDDVSEDGVIQRG